MPSPNLADDALVIVLAIREDVSYIQQTLAFERALIEELEGDDDELTTAERAERRRDEILSVQAHLQSVQAQLDDLGSLLADAKDGQDAC